MLTVVIDADLLCLGSLLGSIEIVVHSFLCDRKSGHPVIECLIERWLVLFENKLQI